MVDEVVLLGDALGLFLPPQDVNGPGIGVHTSAGCRLYRHAQEHQACSELQQEPADLHERHCSRSERSTCVSERICHSGLNGPNGNVPRPRVDKTEGLVLSLTQMNKYRYFNRTTPMITTTIYFAVRIRLRKLVCGLALLSKQLCLTICAAYNILRKATQSKLKYNE